MERIFAGNYLRFDFFRVRRKKLFIIIFIMMIFLVIIIAAIAVSVKKKRDEELPSKFKFSKAAVATDRGVTSLFNCLKKVFRRVLISISKIRLLQYDNT